MDGIKLDDIKTVTLVLEMAAKAEDYEHNADLIVQCVAKTKTEKGCQCYRWDVNADKTVYRVHEIYDDAAAVDTHMGNVGELLPQFKWTPTNIIVIGVPSAGVQEALTGMGCKAFPAFAYGAK